ncbi:MAG TPA: cation diffusion facilitator family transporter [Candidatus Methylomirabilis sp.]|nr:cation diffusion facilitator family transporter [Candidatus Methylomirabilis sp.]
MHSHHPSTPHDHAHTTHGGTLRWALLLTLSFAFVEALGGWWSGSLALLGDAGHMLSDAVALGLAGLAAWISRRPPSARHSYGLMRAEVIAALLNGLLMLAVVLGIVVEAIRRLQQPQPVSGLAVIGIASVGLVINVIVALVLSRGEHDMNTRAALLHVIGDLLGSVAALIAGAVIFFTGWTPIDPILSLAICALILYSTLRLLRDALHVLMEGVPGHLDLNSVGNRLARVPGVVSVHDLHIWMLSSGMPALSAHVVLERMTDWTDILEQMRDLLREHYRIEHVTLQPEIAAQAHKVHIHPVRPRKSEH